MGFACTGCRWLLLCLSVYGLMLLHLKVLGCCQTSISLLYICFSISGFLSVSLLPVIGALHIARSLLVLSTFVLGGGGGGGGVV